MEDELKNVSLLVKGDEVRHEGHYCMVHKILLEPQFGKVWVAWVDGNSCVKTVYTTQDTVWVKQGE